MAAPRTELRSGAGDSLVSLDSLASPSLRTGLLLATAVTLLLSASNIAILTTGPQVALERKINAMDEDFYLSLIREAAEGHTILGNSSLREHRDDRSIVTFFPLIPGLLMRFFEWKLGTVLFLMDALFSFLTTLFFFIAWRGLYKSTWIAIVATLVALSVWRGGLLNIVNPKMVITLAAAYLALFFGRELPSSRTYVLRGGMLGIMLYAYPHYFLYFGVLEVCDVTRRVVKRNRPLVQCARDMAFLWGAFLLLSIPYFSFALRGGESDAAADLWHRQVIPSHLPADPRMQLALLLGISALVWLRRKSATGERTHQHQIDLLMTALFAGLMVLNQSLLHGLDIMFGLHYRLLLTMFLWLAGIFCFLHFVSNRALRTAGLFLLALWSLIPILQIDVLRLHRVRQAVAASFLQSDAPAVLTWLTAQRGEQIILAPSHLADLIPVYTSHYVAWNGYANFQSVTDAELAERYVLQELVEPQQESERDRSYPQIFSVHAGNRAARARTWCRLSSLFQKSEEECHVDVRTMIRNQEVLRQLKEDLATLSPEKFLALLRQFSVDIVVSDIALPPLITRSCPREETIGTYMLYVCRNTRK